MLLQEWGGGKDNRHPLEIEWNQTVLFTQACVAFGFYLQGEGRYEGFFSLVKQSVVWACGSARVITILYLSHPYLVNHQSITALLLVLFYN